MAGDKRADVTRISDNKISLTLPKQPAGYYDLTLVTDIGRITYSGILHYVDSEGNEQNQTGAFVKSTFAISGFKAGSSKLTSVMTKQLKSKVEYSRALTVTCVGETSGPTILRSDPALATARAKAVCEVIARQLGIGTVKLGRKNSKLNASSYRRVLVTITFPK